MKIRAKVSFAGVLSMYPGQELDCDDEAVLKDLLDCGYVEEVTPDSAIIPVIKPEPVHAQKAPAKGGKSGESKRNNRK